MTGSAAFFAPPIKTRPESDGFPESPSTMNALMRSILPAPVRFSEVLWHRSAIACKLGYMFVVQVIPIARGGLKGPLSFFSKAALPEGAVIDVPIRGKMTPAVIIEAREAREEKLALRGSAYALKKIAPKGARMLFPKATLEALRDTALWHGVSLGETLAHFSPAAALSAAPPYEPDAYATHDSFGKTAADLLVLQAEYEERVRMYRSLAREAFARGQSLLILVPTIAEAEGLYDKLHRGIEERVIVLSSASTRKAATAAWKRALNDPEPLVFITTYSFLAIPRRNLNAIIVERESARGYISRERPHINARVAAEYLAKRGAGRVIFADFPLRIETRARLQAGELEELARLQVSSQGDAQVRIVDTRAPKEDETKRPHTKKRFSVFSDTVREAAARELARGGRVFLYASRRGLAPLTVCNDCDTPVTDPRTGAPMTLQKTEKENVFLSYRSGALIPANTSCRVCGSWNLVSLGIGVERVIEEAEKYFKGAPLFALTAISAPSHAKAKKIQRHFFNTPGALLVGTDRALPYLQEPVELSAVMSIDSLLSISAWRANEYALATLFYLQGRTQDAFFVQTRMPENAVITAIASGNPTEFIRSELKDRQTYRYPPFATFIGLSWTGTEHVVAKISASVNASLEGWDVVGPLPARQTARNRFLARAVVRLPKGAWPDARLSEALKGIPSAVAISIDPDEIV